MRLLLLCLCVHQIFTANVVKRRLDQFNLDDAIASFSDELIKKLEYKDKNLMYSPFGMAMTLGMLLKAADGKTKEDIHKLLQIDGFRDHNNIHKVFKNWTIGYKEMATKNSIKEGKRNATLELTNLVLWAENRNVPQTFSDALKAHYEANVGKENFATNSVAVTEKINNYVNERTHELIPKLFAEPINPLTQLMIINTLYFKGFWLFPFDVQQTSKQKFFNIDKTETDVDFMTRTFVSNKYGHFADHAVSVIELRYLGDFSMYVLLPDEKYGLAKLVEEWHKNELNDYIPKMNTTRVTVHLPKWEIDYRTNLLEVFPKLGADITPALTPLSSDLLITDAFQKAKIKVHESGTEAAAVTVVNANVTILAQRPSLMFNADHPFMYVIRDQRNKAVLFAGTVSKLE